MSRDRQKQRDDWARYRETHREERNAAERERRAQNREAYRARANARRAANREKYTAAERARRSRVSEAGKEVMKAASRAYRSQPTIVRKTLLVLARRRADAKGVPFELEIEDIRIPAQCPVLGMRLSYGVKGNCKASPSIERIVPELGYVPGNVMVISHLANRFKADATWQELRAIADFYERLEKMNALDRFLIMRGLAA